MTLRDYVASLGIDAEVFSRWLLLPADKEILGYDIQKCDYDHETIQGKETYAWYRAFAEWVQPKVIAEIGVRFGYTLKALTVPWVENIYGFDNESYVEKSLNIAKRCVPRGTFYALDTQKLNKLPISDVDIFHVDGDHTSAGAYHDMSLAYDAVREGGWILVDDVQGLYYQTQQDFNVRQAVNQFCSERKLGRIFIPTYRGMYAIRK